jgi:ubiquinone biosynthesis monooxygenase Coq7
MRIDHTGEVCAQALYQGQALTSRSSSVREKMQQSALEENDHLIWCRQRLQELHSHTSYLNPIWYTGSLLIGILAGLLGDRWNLGFVAETEHQVSHHLQKHLEQLPKNDIKSTKILQQMQMDELHHATVAIEGGAKALPETIKQLMKILSKLMTTTTYWI